AALAAIWLLIHAAGLRAQTVPATAPEGAPVTSVQATDDLVDRPVAEVRLEGLKSVTQQEVLNNIRTASGDPFDLDTVKADINRLTRLGKFRNIDAIVQLQADCSFVVLFRFAEQQLLMEV